MYWGPGENVQKSYSYSGADTQTEREREKERGGIIAYTSSAHYGSLQHLSNAILVVKIFFSFLRGTSQKCAMQSFQLSH